MKTPRFSGLQLLGRQETRTNKETAFPVDPSERGGPAFSRRIRLIPKCVVKEKNLVCRSMFLNPSWVTVSKETSWTSFSLASRGLCAVFTLQTRHAPFTFACVATVCISGLFKKEEYDTSLPRVLVSSGGCQLSHGDVSPRPAPPN